MAGLPSRSDSIRAMTLRIVVWIVILGYVACPVTVEKLLAGGAGLRALHDESRCDEQLEVHRKL